MTQDYTREEIAEILQKTHKMSGDVDGGIFRLLEIDCGILEVDLNYHLINLWSGKGDVDTHALQILCDSYRNLERRLSCFYEMLEID